ncbi:hypothetical protein Q0M94_03105 [Deinococcus radiomollis]|uniref:hypothetical protein n=1 Tax=Deinococcus radiomollis TaxID=468916 RepID=UPI003891A39E
MAGGWRTSRAPLSALALLSAIGVFQLLAAHTRLYLIAAVLLALLMVVWVKVVAARLDCAAGASGMTRYRLEDHVLHLQNKSFQVGCRGVLNGARVMSYW